MLPNITVAGGTAYFGVSGGIAAEAIGGDVFKGAPYQLRQPVNRVVVVGDVPQQPVAFQARPELLERLTVGGGVSVVCAVMGLRGVGKTQLAAAAARARMTTPGWRLVAWLDAEDQGVLSASLLRVAEAMDLDCDDPTAVRGAVRYFLESSGKGCLLVLDNAVDADALRPLLPAVGLAQVILTTTEESVTELGEQVLVDVYTLAEAVAFLTERTGLQDTAGARRVAEELGRLPLAVAQAAAVIRSQRLDYDTYLKRLAISPVARYLPRTAGDRYPRSTAQAILLALDSIATSPRLCRSLLELLSLASTAGLPRAYLRRAGELGLLEDARDGHRPKLTALDVDEALGVLAGSSLVSFSVDGVTVTAHRLVMRVIREHLAQHNRLTAAAALILTLLVDQRCTPDDAWQRTNWAEEWVRQVTALADHLPAELWTTPPATDLAIKLLNLRAYSLFLLNEIATDPGRVIRIGQDLYTDCRRILGDDHRDTLDSRNHLAMAYQEAGRLADAITLHEQILADRRRVLGDDHPDTLLSRSNLANAYRAAGRVAEAITLHEELLADCRRVLGDDHPDTLTARNELASVHELAGRVVEAVTLHEQVLADRGRALADDHPDTLTSYNNLANAYRAAGRVAEAIALHEQNLTTYGAVLGDDHPDTLLSRYNLATVYRVAGRVTEAITLHEQVLADRRRILGDDHPDTLLSRNGLANAYRAAGRVVEAITLHEQNLADCCRVLGDDHPDTLLSGSNLASAYQVAGRLCEAFTLHELVLASRRGILGADHPDTLTSCNNLAFAYLTVGGLAEAVTLFEKVLGDRRRILGDDHPHTLNTRDNLASTYQQARRTKDAARLRSDDW